MIDRGIEQATTPYASGGGGTVLEHLYAAVLLSRLLIGDPITELGDDATPVSIRFQGRTLSAVDDLIVSGTARDEERRVSIGVRRAPDLTKSDKKTARLLIAYVQMVAEHWETSGPGDGGSTSRSLFPVRPSLNCANLRLSRALPSTTRRSGLKWAVLDASTKA